MLTITREQVLQEIAELGTPLENIFTITSGNEDDAVIVLWYPEIGLRELIIEDNELYHACVNYLRDVGVRQFTSWRDLEEAQMKEQWLGWNTCSDWRRWEKNAEELAKKAARIVK